MELEQKIEARLGEELRIRNSRLFFPHLILIFVSCFFGRFIFIDQPYFLASILTVCLSLGLRYLVLNSEAFKKYHQLFLIGVASTGLGWGAFFYLIFTNHSVFSLEGVFSLFVITAMFGGAVTALSASLKASRVFLTSIAIVPVCVLFFLATFETSLLGCMILINYVYHMHHAALSHQNIRSVLAGELREQSHRSNLQDFLNVIPGFVAIINSDGEYQMVNQKLAPGASITSLFHEFLKGDKESDVQEVSLTENGEEAWYMVHLRRAPSGEGMVAAVLPITELIQARSELKIQEAKAYLSARLASLGEVAAGIAHEVNNPLTIIEGAATVLSMHVSGTDIDRKLLLQMSQKIVETTGRINRVVRSLKKLSRQDTNEPFQKISLGAVIEPSLEISRARILAKNIQVKVPESLSEVMIEGREVELGQVMVNLVSNAIDAVENSETKWIEIRYEINGDWCDIFVTDSGPGIPAKLEGKIMEPFFTTKEPNQGTGLGLSISKTIIEKHFGELTILPHTAFTTFRVRIPKRIDYERLRKDALLVIA